MKLLRDTIAENIEKRIKFLKKGGDGSPSQTILELREKLKKYKRTKP